MKKIEKGNEKGKKGKLFYEALPVVVEETWGSLPNSPFGFSLNPRPTTHHLSPSIPFPISSPNPNSTNQIHSFFVLCYHSHIIFRFFSFFNHHSRRRSPFPCICKRVKSHSPEINSELRWVRRKIPTGSSITAC